MGECRAIADDAVKTIYECDISDTTKDMMLLFCSPLIGLAFVLDILGDLSVTLWVDRWIENDLFGYR